MGCINCECETCQIKALKKTDNKRCTMCKEIKNKSNFQSAGKSTLKNGDKKLKSICKDCRKIKNKEYYEKRKEKKKTNQTQALQGPNQLEQQVQESS